MSLTENEAAFLGEIASVARDFSDQYRFSSILLLHHNDADGISSGAILSAAFSRLGVRLGRYCLEKPFPAVLDRIFDSREEQLVVVADFGSGIISQIKSKIPESAKLMILDHHRLDEKYRLNLSEDGSTSWILNPIKYGIKAGTTASASTVCALFARALSQENSDLAWLGVVGWLGDGQDEKGLNLEVREWATASGNLKGDGKKGYSLQTEDRRFYKLPEIVDAVNALGAYDFFSGGPDYALKGLQSGNIEGLLQLSQRSKEKYQLAFGGVDEVSIISDPEAPIQWFELGEKFREFGVKTVGLVCEQLIASRRVDNEKYLVGFQSVPDYIPGLGPIALDQVKVSMRLPVGISNEVRSGRMLSLDKLLPEAAEKIGGFVDACHPHAAAVSIAKGDEMRLIQELKTALKRL